jgi:hypothetical protein
VGICPECCEATKEAILAEANRHCAEMRDREAWKAAWRERARAWLAEVEGCVPECPYRAHLTTWKQGVEIRELREEVAYLRRELDAARAASRNEAGSVPAPGG